MRIVTKKEKAEAERFAKLIKQFNEKQQIGMLQILNGMELAKKEDN
ncbi:MAG: hypothetical protein LUH82_00995 [Clostridiales bacterium]|nr:hypothetical protein [Clostridiales bacterium]